MKTSKSRTLKLIKKNVSVHAERLIRELGMAKNGFFSEELGKLNAGKLCDILDAARYRCVTSGMTAVIPSKFNKKGEPVMKDEKIRQAIASQYANSEEVLKLCSIDRIAKQESCIAVIRDKIENVRIHPTKKQRIKNEELLLEAAKLPIVASVEEVADEAARMVYQFEDHMAIIKATLAQAISIVEQDLDTATDNYLTFDKTSIEDGASASVVSVEESRQRIDLENGDFYLRSDDKTHVLWVDKDTYLKAYAHVNKLTLPVESKSTAEGLD